MPAASPTTPPVLPPSPTAAWWRGPRGELALVLGLMLLSYLLAQVVPIVALAQLPAGPRYPAALLELYADAPLFRFDAGFYRDLVEHGYAFDGNTGHESNIVFFPLYPWLVWLVWHCTPWDVVDAGFVVAHGCFLLAVPLLYWVLRQRYGLAAGLYTVLGLGFSAGSFAFHAYYSESTMLLCLALCFYCHHRQQWAGLAVAACLLGLCRSTSGPLCAVLSLACVWRAWQLWRTGPAPGRMRAALLQVAYGVLASSGQAAWLAYLWLRFGNPFRLLPELQLRAWADFHAHKSLAQMLTLQPLAEYWQAALHRPFALNDVETTTLAWTTLALLAALYGLWRLRHDALLSWGFAGYWLLVYTANAGSPLLSSTHRYFMLMLPLYLALAALAAQLGRWTRRPWLGHLLLTPLWLVNLAYYVVYLALFSRGYWNSF